MTPPWVFSGFVTGIWANPRSAKGCLPLTLPSASFRSSGSSRSLHGRIPQQARTGPDRVSFLTLIARIVDATRRGSFARCVARVPDPENQRGRGDLGERLGVALQHGFEGVLKCLLKLRAPNDGVTRPMAGFEKVHLLLAGLHHDLRDKPLVLIFGEHRLDPVCLRADAVDQADVLCR